MTGAIVLAVALVTSFALFALRTRLLYRLVRLGQPVNRFDDLPKRVELEAEVVLGQKKLLQRFPSGIMHAFIFWGFLVLLTTIVEAIGQIVSRSFTLPLIGDTPVLNMIQDAFAGLVLVGIAIAFSIDLHVADWLASGARIEGQIDVVVEVRGRLTTLRFDYDGGVR